MIPHIRNPAHGGVSGNGAGERLFHVDHVTAQPLLQRLERVQKSGKGWRSCCPACGGRSAKLVVTELDDRVLVHCFGGCTAGDVLAAVGLTLGDLFPPRHWPESPEDRRKARRSIREAGWCVAVNVLSLEAAVVHVAAMKQVMGQGLNATDLERLAQAHKVIGQAVTVLVEGRQNG